MSPLSHAGVNAAITMLNEEYPHERPLTLQQEAPWREVLATLEPGELRRALRGVEHERRPGPLKVLSVVQAARASGEWPGPVPLSEHAQEVLAEAKRKLA